MSTKQKHYHRLTILLNIVIILLAISTIVIAGISIYILWILLSNGDLSSLSKLGVQLNFGGYSPIQPYYPQTVQALLSLSLFFRALYMLVCLITALRLKKVLQFFIQNERFDLALIQRFWSPQVWGLILVILFLIPDLLLGSLSIDVALFNQLILLIITYLLRARLQENQA